MTDDDGGGVFETGIEFRATPWRPAPNTWEQALEAARDDPTLQEFANMLCSLDGYVDVIGEDEGFRETVVMIEGVPSNRTSDLLTIGRRAGWQVDSITWERNRVSFVEQD